MSDPDDKKPTPSAASKRTVRRVLENTSSYPTVEPQILAADMLDNRHIRGFELFQSIIAKKIKRFVIDENTTAYPSRKDPQKLTLLTREERNRDGVLQVEYTCGCHDSQKNARGNCMRQVCEKLIRGEMVIEGDIPMKASRIAAAVRAPARKRYAADGRTVRSAHRTARANMPSETRRLIGSLRERYERDFPAAKPKSPKRGRPSTTAHNAALALVYKASCRLSSEEMPDAFGSGIASGHLRLVRPPHPNTMSRWQNDVRVTEVLPRLLIITSEPFRRRETACIADASKISQSVTSHSRKVDYGGDERPDADWMKLHVLVGVETMVVMAARFSGSKGDGTHEIKHVEALVTEALKTFALQIFLGDKGYLANEFVERLQQLGIKACIPIKQRVGKKIGKTVASAMAELQYWYDFVPILFHEVYRFRVKVEGYFSIYKRITGHSCVSRGRPTVEGPNAIAPSTAWRNETLARLIYMNLRITVNLQEETNVDIDYLFTDRCFPKPTDPIFESVAA